METQSNFDYNPLNDSLIVSRKKDDEKVYGSVRIGNLILDMTKEGRILGLEISNISDFFERVDMDSEILNNLTGAELIVEQKIDHAWLFLGLKTEGMQLKRIPVVIIPMKKAEEIRV